MNGRRIFADIKAKGFDCAVFFDEISQQYLSDFYTTDGVVIVSATETALITDGRYIEAAEAEKAKGSLSDDVNVYLFKKGLLADVNEYLSSLNAKRVCVDPALITVKQLEDLKAACPDGAGGFPVYTYYLGMTSTMTLDSFRTSSIWVAATTLSAVSLSMQSIVLKVVEPFSRMME